MLRAQATGTDDEKLAKGIELIKKMSDKLAAAPSFRVVSEEHGERDAKATDPNDPNARKDVKRNKRDVTRETVIRRPDRMYFKTSGDAENEGYYDGKLMTLILHKDQRFAQAKMPPTLDEALDAVSERYNIPFPIGDLFYSVPADSYLAETTRGGLVGEEDCNGVKCNHLSFQDEGVDWEMWLPVEGDPLPLRLAIHYKDSPRHAEMSMTFKKWDLAPTDVTDDTFKAKVPDDYFGLPIIQSAAVAPHLPPDPNAPPEGDEAAPAEGDETAPVEGDAPAPAQPDTPAPAGADATAPAGGNSEAPAPAAPTPKGNR